MEKENKQNVMNYKKEFYQKLKSDKVKINWNKNPIKMAVFLSFLTVPCKRSKSHLGADNGWTKLFNDDVKLEIGGGFVNGVEYLDNIQFGIKLSNPYNNYVNPFYLFEIMNNEGRLFFANYYKEEINQIVNDIKSDLDFHQRKVEEISTLYDGLKSEVASLFNY